MKTMKLTMLGTGNALLAECSPYDKKWGIGIDINVFMGRRVVFGYLYIQIVHHFMRTILIFT